MGTKKTVLEVDINTNAEEAGGKFVKLQTRIRETKLQLQEAAAAGDKVRFNKLKEDLDELQDQLEKTQVQSKKFGDSLAAVPGPAGLVGKAIKGLDDAFKFLIANPIVAIIAAIGGALLAMKKSLESTAEGQETLNKVSSAFSRLLGPLLALIEKVAVPVFEAFADAIEFVASGFDKFAKYLGISQGKIKEATLSVDKVQQEANKKEEERQAEAQKVRDEKEKERLAKQKQAAEERKKLKEQELKELADGEKEAFLTLMGDREREEYEVNEKYVKLIYLATKYKQDTKQLKEAQAKELAAIDKTYTDKELEEEKKKGERLQKEKDFWNKAKKDADEKRKKEEDDAYEGRLKKLDREVEYQTNINQTLQEGTKAYFEGRLNLINAQETRELADKELTEAEKLAIEKKYQKLRDDVKKDEGRANAMAVAATLDSLATLGNAIASSYDEEAKTSEKAFEKRKKLQKATAIMSAASGIIQILAQPSTLPSPFDFIVKAANALAIGVATAVQIKNIDKTKFDSSGGSGNTSASSTPKAATPAFSGTMSVPAPQIGASQATQSGTLGQTIAGAVQAGNSTSRPIQAYVIGTQVSSQQQLDRRISVAAKMGG
jgi:myosin heavy subunit